LALIAVSNARLNGNTKGLLNFGHKTGGSVQPMHPDAFKVHKRVTHRSAKGTNGKSFQTGTTNIGFTVVKEGTGTPALCDTNITGTLSVRNIFFGFVIPFNFTIPANTATYGLNWSAGYSLYNVTSSVGVSNRPLNYLPSQSGTTVDIVDGEYLDNEHINQS